MLKGKAWRFGDDVDTDAIIPARYLNLTDPAMLAQHCMEGADPDFARKVQPGDILVGAKNFGCGSSRDHAPVAIRGAGLSAVIARSFARIFFRNAINIGLPILECPSAADAIQTGDDVEIDLTAGRIRVKSGDSPVQEFHVPPFPPEMQELVAAGGLMAFVKQRLQET